MTKELWIRISDDLDTNQKLEILTKCKDLCAGVHVSPQDVVLAKKVGINQILSYENGTIQLVNYDPTNKVKVHVPTQPEIRWAAKVTITHRDDEKHAIDIARSGASYLIVECPNWKIIPLENLIAEMEGREMKLIAIVDNIQEAIIALDTLELGVNGILLEARTPDDVVNATKIVSPENSLISLTEVTVTSVTPVGKGARVCVDTCDILHQGEGGLVGSQSSGLFLVEAEVYENPHVEPRPFRINAGPVSSYILTCGGNTRYLNELKAGDEILIVDKEGHTRTSIIARVKVEIRPMMLVEAEYEGAQFKGILQNAETVRLIAPDGSKSISELKPGDKVLLHHEEGGRHFGILVSDEMIIER